MRSAVLALLVLAAAAAPARAGCIQALVVDGRLMVGQGAPAAGAPPPAGRVPAVHPACNDAGQGEPDVRTTATRLRGVPPRVGVLYEGTLYVATGTLASIHGHPLRDALPRPRRLPRRRDCEPDRAPVRGPARYAGYGYNLTLGTGRDTTALVVDGRTRIVGHPPEQPVLIEQRLRVHTSRCGSRRFADRIVFEPPLLEPERIVPDFDREPADSTGGLLAVAAVVLLLLAVLAGARLRRG